MTLQPDESQYDPSQKTHPSRIPETPGQHAGRRSAARRKTRPLAARRRCCAPRQTAPAWGLRLFVRACVCVCCCGCAAAVEPITPQHDWQLAAGSWDAAATSHKRPSAHRAGRALQHRAHSYGLAGPCPQQPPWQLAMRRGCGPGRAAAAGAPGAPLPPAARSWASGGD
jgi:hypothetical protein